MASYIPINIGSHDLNACPLQDVAHIADSFTQDEASCIEIPFSYILQSLKSRFIDIFISSP